MSSVADRVIAALRVTHDELHVAASGLTDAELLQPSGASEWDVAQVLSHLGSSAEVALAGLRAALAGEPAPDQSFTESVWARWNALGPREKAAGFLESTAALVESLEALTPEQRAGSTLEVSFLPFPLSVAAVAGMRLNEVALHSWDVRVAFDPAAAVPAVAAEVLLELLGGELGFMLGFTGKAEALGRLAAVSLPSTDSCLVIADGVSVAAAEPTAAFSGPAESVVRLLAGRLDPDHTPSSVEVTGDVTLEELRGVFPGY